MTAMRLADPPLAARPLLSVAEAALLAGVCRRTIYNWLTAGKLHYLRTISGRVRIYPDSLFQKRSERLTGDS